MKIFNKINHIMKKIADPKRLEELRGERVVFKYLFADGFLNTVKGKRILEVGPKHGKDSQLLARLEPSEIVFLDLPEKNSLVMKWLPEIKCKNQYIQGNLLYLTHEQTKQ